MADLLTHVGPLSLRNPLVLASGPLSHDGAALVAAHRAGLAAAVTKTIRPEPARNPLPHIAAFPGSLLNSERWSDLPAEQWIQREIPLAKDGEAVVIASVGATAEDVRRLAGPLADAGADALEVCSYEPHEAAPMVAAAVDATSLPVFAKVSANWPDVVSVCADCLAAGAAGVTAIDSIGPALRLDIDRRAPVLGDGAGWISGAAILPLALRVVADVSATLDANVIGTGGVSSANDVIEMMMAGAHAVGLCTHLLIEGLDAVPRLLESLDARLDALRVARVEDVVGAALPALARAREHPHAPARTEARQWQGPMIFVWSEPSCTGCHRCVRVCPYAARSAPDTVDSDRCRFCGLCVSACPTGALRLHNAMT